jgi:ABC-type multidrug transport system ATPase subunit
MDRIIIDNAAIGFGERNLFTTCYINIVSSEVFPLLGVNGSGKSTFIKVTAGLIKSSSGKISAIGSILYQPQNPVVFQMSVLQNAIVGMKIPDKSTAAEVLKSVGLERFINKPAKTLSGGEQQRLFLARSMLTGGDIMLLDEPFSAVDNKTDGLLKEIFINYCKKNNVSLIMSTHSIKAAESISDRCLLIKDGKLDLSDIKSAKEYLVSAI